jgi:hypothetical protein
LPIVLPKKTTIIVDSKKYCKLGSWTPMYQWHSNCQKIDRAHLSNIYRERWEDNLLHELWHRTVAGFGGANCC